MRRSFSFWRRPAGLPRAAEARRCDALATTRCWSRSRRRLLPHGMKLLFDQTRPDRMTVLGHAHGISFSGKREDAFPSGHALHMGALLSAAGTLPAGPRRATRIFAVGLSLTRVVVLAHWASDVVAGFALGAVLESVLRLWTGFPLEASRDDDHANS